MNALWRYPHATCVLSVLTLSFSLLAPTATAQPTDFTWTNGDPLTNNYTAAGNWGNFFTDADPTPNNADERARFGPGTSGNQTVEFDANNVLVGSVLISGSDTFDFTGGRLTIDDGIFSSSPPNVFQNFHNPISTNTNGGSAFIANQSGETLNSSGVLRFFNTVTVNKPLRINPNEFGQPIEFRGVVNGPGDVFIEAGAFPGFGTVIFWADNGFDDLVINADTTVELRGGGRLDRDTNVTILRTGTLALYGITDAIDGLDGDGEVALFDGAGLVIGNFAGFGSVGNGDFGGSITGDGSLIKRGVNGTFILRGGSSYTGGTLVQEGTMLVDELDESAQPAMGTGAVTVEGGATLEMRGSNANPYTIRGGGLLSPWEALVPTRLDGPVTFEPGAIVRIDLADTPGNQESLTFGQNIDLTDTLLRVTLPADTEMLARDQYSILTFDDTRTGEFADVEFVNLPDTYRGELLYTATGADVRFSLIADALAGDFNDDGRVDGNDFLHWQRNPSVGDLADWQASYGTTPPLFATSTVPEPTSLLLLTGAVVLCSFGRRVVMR